MKTLLKLAFTSIAALILSFHLVNAQERNHEERLRQYDQKLREYQQELKKMEEKLDTLTGKIMHKEALVSEKDSGDCTQTRKTITLEDNTPGKKIKVMIYDSNEITKEQEQELLENLQSLRGLETLGSLSNLFQSSEKKALSEPENATKLEKIEVKLKKFEDFMTEDLNNITDKLAEIEMDRIQLNNESNGDTTVIRLGTSKIVIIEDGNEKNNSIQWKKEKSETEEDQDEPKEKDVVDFSALGLSLGLNSFMYKGNTNLPLKYNNLELEALRSWNVNLKLVEAKISLINHQVNLLTGISLDWNNYRFRNNINLSPRTDTLYITRDTIDFKKNKLMTQNLMGHLMLQFESKPGKKGKTFDIGAGGFAGYMLNARTKQVSDARGKNKFEDDFQLNSFRYGLCGRIGYGAFDLYVNYTLNDIFRPNLGPSVQNLSFGLNFTGL